MRASVLTANPPAPDPAAPDRPEPGGRSAATPARPSEHRSSGLLGSSALALLLVAMVVAGIVALSHGGSARGQAASAPGNGGSAPGNSASAPVSQAGEPQADPIGGAAEPPLPANSPTGFDPVSELANHDGSLVARLRDQTLTFVDGRSGTILTSTEVPPGLELRAFAADGSQAALFARRDDSTEIVVVAREAPKDHLVLRFDGLVEPEAFATDGGELFAIDHGIAAAPGSYRVRPIDLETGRLETIVGPTKLPLDEEMNGRGRRQVWSSDGTRLYTLYIRQTHHHHDEPTSGSPDQTPNHSHPEPGTDGFVHVLDLDEEWAFCLDLPPAFGGGDLDRTALAVSPAGGELAVLDLEAGAMALASTEQLLVTDVVPLPPGLEPDERIHLGLFPTHLAVGWGDRVRWLDRPSLQTAAEVELPGPLLGFSSFDSTLLAWQRDATDGPAQLTTPVGRSSQD